MYCPACGVQNEEYAKFCCQCGKQLPQIIPPPREGKELELVLPVNVNVWALVAGYLGLASLFFGLPGPFAIFCGIRALRALKNNPNECGVSRAWVGIILGIVGILLLALMIVSLIMSN